MIGQAKDEERERSRDGCHRCSLDLPVELGDRSGIKLWCALCSAEHFCLSDQHILCRWNPLIRAKTEYRGATAVFYQLPLSDRRLGHGAWPPPPLPELAADLEGKLQ